MKIGSYFIFFLLLMFITPDIQAACFNKNTPWWGTGDTKETCRYKAKQVARQKALELKARDLEINKQEYNLRNGITGNNNVVLGLGGLFGKNQQENADMAVTSLVQTKHQLRVEIMGFLKADSAYFNAPKAPDAIFFNGAAWEYYVSPNMGFGVLWQQFSLSGARDFDVIKDNSGDVLFFPGNVTKGDYSLLLPYVTFNGQISDPWHWTFQVGIGRNEVKLEYKEVDYKAYPNARKSEDRELTDSAAFMFGLNVEKWSSGMKYGCGTRIITSSVDTSDYLEQMNMGSQQFLCYVQWMIRPLGLL